MSGRAMAAVVGDIGGTNARLALVGDGRCGAAHNYAVADFTGPEEAIRQFLDELDAVAGRVVLAVAGPVEGGRARLTNGAWLFDEAAIGAALGMAAVRLVNDFVALGHAVARYRPDDLLPLGGGAAVADAPKLVLGPGTGLGMAVCLPDPPGIGTVLPTEGGHVTLAATDAREAAIIAHLRRRFDHVSAERLLSGSGLELLYEAVSEVDGLAAPAGLGADEITENAVAGGCAASRATLETFCAMLGGVAGNAVLTVGARGGVYLAGGILPRVPRFLAESEFRTRFEAKGRFRGWLADVPVNLVTRPDQALPGLMAILETMA